MNDDTPGHRDPAGLTCGEAGIAVAGGILPAYFARPADAPPRATVMVVQEIFGVHPYIRAVCQRLAAEGYLAVAPELFFRQGDPALISEIPRLLSDIVAKVSDAQVMDDLDATAAWAAGQGGGAGLGITGFCWGGRVVWLYAAHHPALRAGVAWYGRLRDGFHPASTKQPIELAAALRAPVLGLYGAEDTSIPAADAMAMQEALAAAGRAGEIVIYPRAGHAFHADYRASYQREAAEDGWRRMLAWLSHHGL